MAEARMIRPERWQQTMESAELTPAVLDRGIRRQEIISQEDGVVWVDFRPWQAQNDQLETLVRACDTLVEPPASREAALRDIRETLAVLPSHRELANRPADTLPAAEWMM